MHSRIFYISDNKTIEEAPCEDSVFEALSGIADYLCEESSSEMEQSLEWLSGSDDFPPIQKDESNFYFEINKETLQELQTKIYTRIKSRITELLSTPSLDLQILWEIQDVAYGKFEMYFIFNEDPPETIERFILGLSAQGSQPERYYFIKSYDYHY